MIIGINGKMGVGKDTVGSIIQYLTARDVRTECRDRIAKGLSIDGCHNSEFEIKKFAGKLKQIASILSGIPEIHFEDQEFKRQRMTADWGMTYREFLQKLGTEAMRDGLHEDIWVNALFADYKQEVNIVKVQGENNGFIDQRIYPSWILTDMRFPNEMESVKERGGITIRVRIDNNTRAINTNPHPSETALDDVEFDYEIINDGSISDLIKKVSEILIKEQLV